jgi:hypothetical protein
MKEFFVEWRPLKEVLVAQDRNLLHFGPGGICGNRNEK